MKVIETNKLSSAVRVALTMGVATTAGFAVTAQAQNAESDAPKNQNLETIVVTGSNIRRVDMETSNPVITIDRAAIARSGQVTVGDLIQQLPAIAGNANTPRTNNGGGDGGSYISLRGLGTNRSLLLVDGHRVLTSDVNMIPVNMIERVEVLLEGASSVYGSDAIGGVVNIILRNNYQGAELSTQYGISDRDDGATKNFSLIFGQSTDKGSLMGGIDYNKNEQILGGNRDFSAKSYTRNAKTGAVSFTGSVAAPTGFITAPQFNNCASGGGTLDPRAPGGNGIPKGFRCFVNATATSFGDQYNYAPVNPISTNGERTNAFIKGNYKLTDSVEAYMSVLHNKTRSNAQLAPTAYALSSSGLTVSSGNPYNPFGVDLGASVGGNYDDSLRGSALGPRLINYSTTNDQVLVGLKGNLFGTSWQWDGNINYGHYSQYSSRQGLMNSDAINQSGALGANCVMPVAGQPLTKNTCLNIMNQSDPNTAALLKQFYSIQTYYHQLQQERQANLNANGDLFELPGGMVSAAVGLAYRKVYVANDSDTITHRAPGSTACGVANSACANPYSGGYNVKEAYAEVLVPIVKDVPFAKSLNLVLGDRYSKYSNFGSTNNWKVGVEFKPIDDLLLRGTVARVFRAPNITESFLPSTTSYDSYTAKKWTSKNRDQIIVNYAGASVAGVSLSPEHGKSFDFGFVYDPQWLPGLSVSVDLYRIMLDGLITRPSGQLIVDSCAASSASPFCNFIQFQNATTIAQINNVGYVNLGRLDTKGADLNATYRLPETSFGNFVVGLGASYITQYDNTIPNPDGSSTVRHIAGTFTKQDGNFARWRAKGTLGWSLGDFSAQWTSRYVGGMAVPDLGTYHVGAWVQNDVTVGYNLEALNTRVDVGINNLGDKQPPFFYQMGPNANTDVNTYDTIGRYYWGRVTVKF
ncbi:MAG: TonB-dependent receptor [Rudaea sp.]|nr:TonB-dependent receptor [Rudaea sp.]